MKTPRLKFEWTLRSSDGRFPYPVYKTAPEAERLLRYREGLGERGLVLVNLAPPKEAPDPWRQSVRKNHHNGWKAHDASWQSWPTSDGTRHVSHGKDE